VEMNLYKTDSIVLNLDAFVGMEKSVIYNNTNEQFSHSITYFTAKGCNFIVFDSEEERNNVYNDIYLQLQLLH